MRRKPAAESAAVKGRSTAAHLAADPVDPAAAGRRRRRGRGRHRAGNPTSIVVALLVVGFGVLAPDSYTSLRPAAFVRIPIEVVVGALLVLVLRRWARSAALAVAGVLLGVVIWLKVLSLGFSSVFGRPFDPVLDWSFFGNAFDFLTASGPQVVGIAAVVAAVLLACAVPLLSVWSVRRLSRVVLRHPTTTVRSAAVLGVGWVVCLLLGVQVVPGEPVAASTTVQVLYGAGSRARSSLHDREEFRREEAVDRALPRPGEQVLGGLKGKDVILAFVESYGRSAVEDPRIAPGVGAVLDAGYARLAAEGFGAASGWLNSPTMGGGSWLAHSTLLSGVRVSNQERYETLLGSDRMTLSSAFRDAGWRTAAVMPATHGGWPEGAFYRYQKIYERPDMRYEGPRFGWSPMPDQFVLAALQSKQLGVPGHTPVMVETELTSSHTPWAPLPKMVAWNDLGDGSLFGPIESAAKQRDDVWPNPDRVRTEYGRSVQYSLTALFSFLERYGTENTVLVFLGDHQPAPIVTGAGASRDVPITIVAKDPAVLRQISGWGWQPGLKPAPTSPEWPMEAFRDRFLAAFTPGSS